MLGWLIIVLGSGYGAQQAAAGELHQARVERLSLLPPAQLVVQPCNPQQGCIETWSWQRR